MVRERRVFKNCPHCGASVRDINFDYHLAKVHSIITESLREEQEFLDQVAFIEDYVERKSLEKLPESLDLEKILEEAEVEWRRSQIPSAGTLMRFILRHYERLYRALQIAYGKRGDLHIDLPQPMLERNEFLAKAEKTGRFKETVLEVEEKKGEVGGRDPDGWAFETQYDILNAWKPGFELHLADLFFSKERCGSCGRQDKREVECEEGRSNCIFDDEFKRFQFQYVKKIVDQLKRDVEPKELEIPEHLHDMEAKMRELGRRMRESPRQEG
jgi:hypothetical protein